MKRNFLLSCLVATLLLISSLPVFATGINDDTGSGQPVESDVILEGPETPGAIDYVDLETHNNNAIELDYLIENGYATEYVMDYQMPDKVGWFGPRSMSSTMAGANISDDNEGPGSAVEMEDGFSYSGNVTTIPASGDPPFQITDQDWFYINLTVDTTNNFADTITIDVFSEMAVDEDAPLLAQFGTFYMGSLFGGNANFDVMDFKSVGGRNDNKSTMKCTVEASGSYYLGLYTLNSTTLNYTIDVSVESSSVSNPEWNALWPSGTFVNSTMKPSPLQVVDQANDTWDWFDLSGMFEDAGLDTDRGDSVRMGFTVEEATAFKGRQKLYYSSTEYGTTQNTCAITWAWVLYNNYTEFANGDPSLHLVMLNQNTPYFISSVFGTGGSPAVSQTIVFQDQIDAAWIGVNPNQLWYSQSSYGFNCDQGAHVQYNISNFAVNLLPPNEAPVLSDPIPDQDFDEDTGPWNITDLMDHFYDEEHATITDGSIPPLEFSLSTPVGVTNPEELKLTIKDNRYLWADVTKPNWFGEGQYRIKCEDWGVANPAISIDDREVRSNVFTIDVEPVNDDAYIEKVDTGAGEETNTHEIIDIFLSQNTNMYRSKKVYGRDNDTEDQNRLVYTHNATTPAFRMNDNGQIDFIPTNDDVGDTYVRIWVDDRNGDDEDDYVDLRFVVSNRNDPPSLTRIEWPDGARSFDLTGSEDTPTFKNVREDFEINLTVTATDPDILIGMPDTLTWVVGANGWNVYNHPTDPLKAYVTYTPTNDDAISTSVETKLSCMDTSNSVSQEITVRLMVENVNDPPTILTVSNEIPTVQGSMKKVSLTEANGKNGFEDEIYSIGVSAEDIDPRDAVTFKSSDPAFQFFPDPTDTYAGNFTIRPTQDMVGMHTVIFTVTDEDGDTDSVTVEFEIVNTNDPPSRDFSLDWETAVDFVVGNNITFFVEDISDPDGDELTVIWDFGDNTGTFEGETVQHSFANDQPYIITVKVRDPSGLEVEKTRTITIYPKEEEEPPEDLDTDGDGMPDIYEDENGLNKNLNDSNMDEDKDGFTNLEEYKANTNPLDPKSHPPKEETDDEGVDMVLVIAVVVVLLFIIIAVGFLFFALKKKPQPVARQQAYGAEMPPGQAQPGLAPQQQQQISGQAPSQQLPPAREEQSEQEEEPEPEEELPDSFLMDAEEQLKQDSEPLPGEENIWRPPVEKEEPETQESQVDDLFADTPEEEGSQQEQEPPVEEEEDEVPKGPPAPPKMPPPPPEP